MAAGVAGCGSSGGDTAGDVSGVPGLNDGGGTDGGPDNARTVDDITQGDSPPLSQVLPRCADTDSTGQVNVLIGAVSSRSQMESEQLSGRRFYRTLRGEFANTVAPASPECRTVTQVTSDADNNDDDYAGFGLRATTASFGADRVEVESTVAEIAGAIQTTYESIGVLDGPIEVPVFRVIDHPEMDMRGFQATLIVRTRGNMRITEQRNFIANELTEDPLSLPASPESGMLDDFVINISAFDGNEGATDDLGPRFVWFGLYPVSQNDLINAERTDLQTGVGLVSDR